jgi:hypothetical protein
MTAISPARQEPFDRDDPNFDGHDDMEGYRKRDLVQSIGG